MSYFVAVRLPTVAVADLAVAQSALPLELAAAHPDLRWTPPQNWHLTLAFLGSVSAARLADLEARLVRVALRHSALTLRLAGSGHFGTRVLYVGVRGDVERLSRLADGVSAAARRAKVSVDARPYRPHLTLARLRGTAPLGDLAAALSSYAGPSWQVSQIELMESLPPLAAGLPPSYVSRGQYPLCATPELPRTPGSPLKR
jgi:2'-5' RNA ligase